VLTQTQALPPALALVCSAVAFASSLADTFDGELTPEAASGSKPHLAETPPTRRSVRRPHVILLVLDELPGDSLLDERGRIDPVRYPSFAALAATAT
jgi:hypothetical protein